MNRYLLDANTISDLVHEPDGKIALRVLRTGIDRLCTSIIVAAEQEYGAAKSRSRRTAQRLRDVFATIEVVPFTDPAQRVYGELRADLERRGQPLGPHDMLIAAHALALDCTLVTDDSGFARVRGLRHENWLR
jgi:tRNA(fMet)-specific endonuclease VapC